MVSRREKFILKDILMFKHLYFGVLAFCVFSSEAMHSQLHRSKNSGQLYDVSPAVRKLLALKESSFEAYQRLSLYVIKTAQRRFNLTVEECTYDSILMILYKNRFLLSNDKYLFVNPLYLLLINGETDIEKHLSYDQFCSYL